MGKRPSMGWVSVFIGLLLVLGSPLNGRGDIGDILSNIQPYITLNEEYNSNINLSQKNRQDDFITTVSPGVRFSTLPRSPTTRDLKQPPPSENYGLDLDYHPGFVFYAKDTHDNYIGHEGTMNAWYTWGQKLTFRVKEYLVRSDAPREYDYGPYAIGAGGIRVIYFSGDGGNLGTLPNQYLLGTDRGRAIYLRNVVTPSIDYRFGRDNTVSVNYLNNIYRNQSPLYENSREDSTNFRFNYWFDIRNGISFQYGFTLGNFERSPDLTGHTGTGRYTYRFNPRTSVFGEYTFLRRDLDSPGVDYDVHRPSLGIEHAFSSTLTGTANLGYYWQKPRIGSTQTGPSFDVSLTQRSKRTTYALLFQGGYIEDYFTAQNLGFTKYYRTLGTITYQLAEKASVGLNGSLERPEQSTGQKDWIWGIGTTASYQVLRWLTFSLYGSYRQDHSNFDGADYNEYRGIFTAAASF